MTFLNTLHTSSWNKAKRPMTERECSGKWISLSLKTVGFNNFFAWNAENFLVIFSISLQPAGTTVVVTNQPVVSQPRDFSSGLFGCFEDWESCEFFSAAILWINSLPIAVIRCSCHKSLSLKTQQFYEIEQSVSSSCSFSLHFFSSLFLFLLMPAVFDSFIHFIPSSCLR